MASQNVLTHMVKLGLEIPLESLQHAMRPHCTSVRSPPAKGLAPCSVMLPACPGWWVRSFSRC
eukprot:3080026-Amphidinium_carterae.1